MTTATHPRLTKADLEPMLDRFLQQGNRYGPVEVRTSTGAAPEWRPAPYPGDYGDPAVYIGQQVAGLDSDARRRCLDRLYAAAKEYWTPGPSAGFGYAVGLMLGLVPGTPTNPAGVVEFLSGIVVGGKLRRRPSAAEDLHQQAVAALGRPELAGELPPAVLDVLRRDLAVPVYAAVAILALATHLRERASRYLPAFLDAARRGGYPPNLILFQFVRRVETVPEGDSDAAIWEGVGQSLRSDSAAAGYLSELLRRSGRATAREAFTTGLKATARAPGIVPQRAGGSLSPLLIEVTDKIAIPVVDRAGASKGTLEIDPAEFGGKISRQLMHDVVLMYLANQRAGTHHTLRRGQVAGSTKKLFRQKGTGNARVGTKRTNKRVGGGTAKGPKPRDYEYHLPKKAVRAATRMAILSKFRDGEAVVLDDLTLAGPKTKEIVGVLKAIKVGKKKTAEGAEKDVTLADTTVLIGTAGLDPNVYKSARNVEGVKVLPAAEFNCYTVLKQKRLVLTRAALEALRKPEAAKPPEGSAAEPQRVRRGRAGEIQKRKKKGGGKAASAK